MKRTFMLGLAWICVILGFTGVVLPVLPTTPFLLLAVFLFTRHSPRAEAWLKSTKVYAKYVTPFKSSGGLPLSTKIRILAISYAVIGLSAYFSRKPIVWIILTCCVIFLFYLMLIRIPTISKDEAQAAEMQAEQDFQDSQAISNKPTDEILPGEKPQRSYSSQPKN